jgi:hypothetical protein
MRAGGPGVLAMRAWAWAAEDDWEAAECEVWARARPEWKASPPSMLVASVHLLAAVRAGSESKVSALAARVSTRDCRSGPGRGEGGWRQVPRVRRDGAAVDAVWECVGLQARQAEARCRIDTCCCW